MCTGKPKNVSLPMQSAICDSENSACTMAELKTGFSKWEKRMTVFARKDGEHSQLLIYTYFLHGLGAGLGGTEPVQDACLQSCTEEPHVGQMIDLDKLESCETKKEKDGYLVKLKSAKGEKVTLKFTGKDAAQWTSAVITGDFKQLLHNTHRPTEKKAVKEMAVELKDKSDEVKEQVKEVKKPKTPSAKSTDEDKKKAASKNSKSKTHSEKNLKKAKSKSKSSTTSDKKKKTLSLADTQTFEMDPLQFGEHHSDKEHKQTLETATSSGKREKKKKKNAEVEEEKPSTSGQTPDKEK